MSKADDITTIFADAAPLVADAFHASVYTLFRVGRTDAGLNWQEQAPVAIHTGRCEMVGGGYLAGAGAGYMAGELAFDAVSTYSAELPREAGAAIDHLIEIDGTRFRIVDVVKPDPWSMFVTVSLELHK